MTAKPSMKPPLGRRIRGSGRDLGNGRVRTQFRSRRNERSRPSLPSACVEADLTHMETALWVGLSASDEQCATFPSATSRAATSLPVPSLAVPSRVRISSARPQRNCAASSRPEDDWLLPWGSARTGSRRWRLRDRRRIACWPGPSASPLDRRFCGRRLTVADGKE